MKDANETTKSLTELGMLPFNWSDPFLLSEQLSEDERLIKNSAEIFALKHDKSQ